MPCGWEGNRRAGIALAMRYKLHPAYTPQAVGTLYLYWLTATTPTMEDDLI